MKIIGTKYEIESLLSALPRAPEDYSPIPTDGFIATYRGIPIEFEIIETMEITDSLQPQYTHEKVYLCPPDCGGEEFDEWGEVPHCPKCNNRFRDCEKPNYCPKCGQALDWSLETKKDMSSICGMRYEEYWNAVHIQKTITQECFDKWLHNNCYQCKFLSEVCMKE